LNGTGQYEWYDVATGGNSIGSGDVFGVEPSQTTTYYVEDVSSFNGFVGPTSTSGTGNNWGEKGYNDGFYVEFSPTTDFSILSLDVPVPQIHSNADATLGVEIRDNSGTLLATFVSEPKSLTGSNDATIINFEFTDFDIKASWGTDLRMALSTVETNIPANLEWYQDGSYSFPYTTASGAVSITGTVANNSSGNNYFYFFNWEIAAGQDCDRVGVVATEACAVVVNVFPNPSSNSAFVKSRTGDVSQVSVMNMKGQVVEEFSLNGTTEFGSNLETGVYILQVKEGTQFQNMRFIKE